MITTFQRWVLKRIFRKLMFVEPWLSEKNIISVFKLLEEAAEEEFEFSNILAVDNFLINCYEKAYLIKR